MARSFDRDSLLCAFDHIGTAAVRQDVTLTLALYGGSALMLASNFRFATEDADIAELAQPWPGWLRDVADRIAADFGWSPDWLNEAVQFHLSPLADPVADHHEFGSFPRGGTPGLVVLVPSAAYMLALKLKAMRINDTAKGVTEAEDIRSLLRVAGVRDVEQAIGVLGQFFPRSAKDADRQRFFLKYIWPDEARRDDPPRYPVLGG